MPSDLIIRAADLGQAAVPLLSLVAYLPQWIKLCRGKNSGSMSMRAWTIWTVSSLLALFYAIVQLQVTGRGWALVLSTGLGLAFVVVTLLLVVRFRSSGSPS
ncbi:MAG: PQ-loop domain-containing transporter [Opitutales bacterium]|jgi:uncharacterized protein with PQ loop repeat